MRIPACILPLLMLSAYGEATRAAVPDIGDIPPNVGGKMIAVNTEERKVFRKAEALLKMLTLKLPTTRTKPPPSPMA